MFFISSVICLLSLNLPWNFDRKILVISFLDEGINLEIATMMNKGRHRDNNGLFWDRIQYDSD